MCRRHWAIVPLELKIEVQKNFNAKQCKGLVRPTDAYLKAAREALNFVAKKTGNFIEGESNDSGN